LLLETPDLRSFSLQFAAWCPLLGRYVWIILAVMLCVSQIGCVQRRMFIASNPPGALVSVNNREIGVTPVATHFPYYGTYQIKVAKDGFQTLNTQQSIRPPWYEYPPFDLVSENFIPGEVRDHRTMNFNLQPRVVVPQQQLLERADALRRGNRVLPAGPGR